MGITPLVGGALVFLTSAAVLVLEILATRLLAPYVGVTLETYTATIGTILAGIATGTWLGGYAADRIEPRRMLGPLLMGGGALSVATVPLVRLLGDAFSGAGGMSVVPLTLASFLAPAAVLSAVSPTVVKLQLRSLAVTGGVVGRLSALGTAGAIVGTFVAGFFLVDVAPTSTSILVIGGLLMVAGAVLWAWLSTARSRLLAAVAAVGLVAAGAGVAAANPCDVETTYHCAQIIEDGTPGGRLLILDTLRNSYVDLDDPTYLEFRYVKVFADVLAAEAPSGRLDVLHIGGGGFTMPRYVAAVRPGSQNLVLEIDPDLAPLARRRLGLKTGPDLEVRAGDARVLADDLPPAGYDAVLGDAFGGLAVPWHLTTREFLETVRARLRPGGVYVVNVIDLPPTRFARAEVATLLEVFGHVAVLAPPSLLDTTDGGNYVLAGSDAPFDEDRLTSLVRARRGEERVLVDRAAATFANRAPVLTDDHAPVDQWLARARRS